MNLNLGEENFLSEWKATWGNDSDEEYIRRKYKNLSKMLDMKPGDIVIVPKVPDFRKFLIVEITEYYSFDEGLNRNKDEINDFKHNLGIKILSKVSYSFNNYSKIISSSFRGYQSSVNSIRKDEVINSIENLICKNEYDITEEKDNISALDVWNNELFDNLANNLIENINHWSPSDFEDIIKEIFENNGFLFQCRNKFDGKGGDVDLIFSYPEYNVMSDILLLNQEKFDNSRQIPQIYI